MRYEPPVGSSDPDAPYLGRNLAAGGSAGSRVPAAAIENTQREIVNAILAAGLAPSAADKTQLAQAIAARALAVIAAYVETTPGAIGALDDVRDALEADGDLAAALFAEIGEKAAQAALDVQTSRIDAMLSGASGDANSFAEIVTKLLVQAARIDGLLAGAPIDGDTFAEVAVKLASAIAALKGAPGAEGDTLEKLDARLVALADEIDAAEAAIAAIGVVSSGPSAGYHVGVSTISELTLDPDGGPIRLGLEDGREFHVGFDGAEERLDDDAVEQIVQRGVLIGGPSAGYRPGTVEPFEEVTVGSDGLLLGDRDPLSVISPPGAIAIPPAEIDYGSGETVTTRAATLNSPAPANVALSDVPVAAGVNVPTFLAYAQIVSIQEVRRLSDSALRTLGTHYTFTAPNRITNLTADALKISYTGRGQRKDKVSVHPVTGAATITLGTERPQNPVYWANPVPPGDIEIGSVFNDGARAAYTPTWHWREGVSLRARDRFAAWLELNRPKYRKIRECLAAGLAVRFIVYGDSRLAIGANGPPALVNANPNSHYDDDPELRWRRDDSEYYWSYGAYDDATRTRLGFGTAQLLDFGDGWGPRHCRQSYAWELIKLLEAAYPGQVFSAGPSPTGSSYRNWSIGGTRSSDGQSGDGYGDGLYPQRWNAVKADIVSGATVFLGGFGANELGEPTTYLNIRTMGEQVQALGAAPLFVTTTRYSPFYGEPLKDWRFTTRETVRAAIDSRAGYVDVSEIVAPENLAGSGISVFELADTYPGSLGLHEGVNVQRAIAQRAASLFI